MKSLTGRVDRPMRNALVLCGLAGTALLVGCEYSPNRAPLEAKIQEAEAGAFGTCMDESYRAGLELEKARRYLKRLQDGSPSDTDLAEGLAAADRAVEMRANAEQACIREQASIAGAVSKVNQVESDLASLTQRITVLESGQRDIREEILIGVTFETNSAKLTPEARAVLDVQADRLVRQGTLVEVAGYASTTGTKERNLELSQQRAESVRAYLLDRGVDKARVVAKGYGETDPIASNATEGGRRANQRIELHYLE